MLRLILLYLFCVLAQDLTLEDLDARITALEQCSSECDLADQCLMSEAPTEAFSDAIFAPLSAAEIEQAVGVLRDAGIVTVAGGAKPELTDNYVYGAALELPMKADVLSDSTPGRFADVHVHRGQENDLAEYIVGPLGEGTTPTSTLRDTYVYNARPRDGIEWDGLDTVIYGVFDVLETLVTESFDGASRGNGLYFHPQAPPGLAAEDRETRFCSALLVEGMARGRDMHFLPLTGTIHNPGQDKSQWYAHSLFYLNQGPFETAEALMDAYNAGSIRKMTMPEGYRDNLFERTFPQPLLGGLIDDFREDAELAGPTVTATQQRFTVDGHKISYLGWDFEVAASQFKGPAIFNIKFMDQSIAYEISLSEVGVVYGSDTSSGANTIYLDSTFGIGEFSNVILGVDCPKYATLLEASWFNSYSQSVVTANAICVFEAHDHKPMWRRRDKFASGSRNHYLVVRIPMSVGNYDYIMSYEFHLDGKIRVAGDASGFLQTAFWDPDNPNRPADTFRDPFGFRVSDYTHGSMHDHALGFKVDMDILGTSNSMTTFTWTAGSVVDAFQSQEGATVTEKPNYFLYDETRYFSETKLTEEVGLNVDLANPKFWVVQNTDEQNNMGVTKGYRVKLDNPATQVLNTHPSLPALGYTKYHTMVTQRKEEERFITGNYDLNQLAEPEIDARTYISGESIEQEDLVLWVNIGFLHIPIAEDVPMTNTVGSAFELKPFNFFDMNPVFDMPSYVDTSASSPVDIHTRETTASDCVSDTSQQAYF